MQGAANMTHPNPDPASHEPITVHIDPDLEDIVPTFLANRRKDLHTIRTAIAEKDFEVIGILGHRMKGDGGGYGFSAISEIGGAMEMAAGRRDQPAIERSLAQLNDFLARVTVVYR
jgi:HPt (histidine-containing phosphotransfer) domain-containing protein